MALFLLILALALPRLSALDRYVTVDESALVDKVGEFLPGAVEQGLEGHIPGRTPRRYHHLGRHRGVPVEISRIRQVSGQAV